MATVDWTPHAAYISDTLALPTDTVAWTEQPYLVCTSLQRVMGPGISRAVLQWTYGTITRPGESSAYVDRLVLDGKFVRLERDGEVWYGYILGQGERLAGEETVSDVTRRKWGKQTIVAVGLEWFLSRQTVLGTSSAEADRSKRAVGYNCGTGDGRSVQWDKRGNKDPGSLAFQFDSDAVLWDASKIVLHLLGQHSPRDHAGDEAPIFYFLHADAVPFLEWFTPSLEVEGRNLWELIGECASGRRCLNYWTSVEAVEGELYVWVNVSSSTAAAISLPALDAGPTPVLPAATTIEAIDDPYAEPACTDAEIDQQPGEGFNRVRVRGARRTTTFSARGESVTVTDVNSLIDALWSDDDEAAYATAAASSTGYDDLEREEQEKRNDRFRQQEKFERVLRYFGINTQTGAGAALSPIIVQSTGSVTGDIPMERLTQRLLTKTKLRAGVDYTDATEPVVITDQPEGEEYVAPFAAAHLPSARGFTPTTLGASDGGWRFAHKLSSVKETSGDDELQLKASYHLQIISGGPGFILRASGNGGMQHSLAYDIGHVLEPTKYKVELAWQAFLVTACVEWDAYCEAVWPEAPPTGLQQELLVQLSDRVRFDWVAKGTAFDVGPTGALKQVTTAGAIRDDRRFCEQIAKLAHAWYSTERAELTLTYNGNVCPYELGTLITTVGTNEAQINVNAVISSISHDMHRGRTTIHCTLSELDFKEFA